MDASQADYLKQHYHASEWLGPKKAEVQPIKDLRFEELTLEGWVLHRRRVDRAATPRSIHMIWRHADSEERLLSIDVYECDSVKAAHDQLIELLGNFETDAMRRVKDQHALGDVHFAFNDATALFAHANVVVLVRSVGRELVPVAPFARKLDAFVGRP